MSSITADAQSRVASLVIAPQWIGDAVMTEPLLRHLAARGEALTVAALPWVAPVYRAMPSVAQVVELPFRHGALDWRARRRLGQSWRGQFDRAYILPNSFKSALLPWFAQISERIGYRGEARWGIVNRTISRGAQPLPMVDFYAALAGKDGSAVYENAAIPLRPQLEVDAALHNRTLEKFQLRPHGYGIFVPGAEYGPAKQWPAQHFSQLGRMRGETVILLGSVKDKTLCSAIAEQIGASARVLAGETTLDEAIALIAAASWQVGNDSGLMHIAAALDTPQVALFGSSSPLHTPPRSAHAEVIWLKDDVQYRPRLDCAPCFKRQCPYGHTRCLHDIAVARVSASVDAVQVVQSA